MYYTKVWFQGFGAIACAEKVSTAFALGLAKVVIHNAWRLEVLSIRTLNPAARGANMDGEGNAHQGRLADVFVLTTFVRRIQYCILPITSDLFTTCYGLLFNHHHRTQVNPRQSLLLSPNL